MTDPAVVAASAADTIAMWSAAAAWVGVLISGGAAFFAWKQWRKINRKMAMLTDSSAIADVLPAWYTRRMVDEHWLFGLLTIDGRTVVIKRILAVSDNAQWMDVELAESDEAEGISPALGPPITAVADDRRRASVKIANIVAAVDLWTS
ncbi:MAG: hypothetical protein ABJF50_18195 [Paracoccaceae bacterium]|uniref:hypothetical protein n=2 Tax=Hyphomonas sp. TaxID=87 RepID=UPI0032923E4F